MRTKDILDGNYTIHRLVAECFIPNPENKPEVNHKDGNGHNPAADNLEWVTRKENTDHAYTTGLIVWNLKTKKCSCGEMISQRNNMCAKCKENLKKQQRFELLIEQRKNECNALLPKCRSDKDYEFLDCWRQGMKFQEIGDRMGFTRQAAQIRYVTIRDRKIKTPKIKL